MTSIVTSMMIVPFRIIRIDLTISHSAFKSVPGIKIIGHIHNFQITSVKCWDIHFIFSTPEKTFKRLFKFLCENHVPQ